MTIRSLVVLMLFSLVAACGATPAPEPAPAEPTPSAEESPAAPATSGAEPAAEPPAEGLDENPPLEAAGS